MKKNSDETLVVGLITGIFSGSIFAGHLLILQQENTITTSDMFRIYITLILGILTLALSGINYILLKKNAARENMKFIMDQEKLWYENASWLRDFFGNHRHALMDETMEIIKIFGTDFLSQKTDIPPNLKNTLQPKNTDQLRALANELESADRKLEYLENLIERGVIDRKSPPKELKDKLKKVKAAVNTFIAEHNILSMITSMNEERKALSTNTSDISGNGNSYLEIGEELGDLAKLMQKYYTHRP